MKHKHADLIHAWADGAQIQLLSLIYDRWEDIKDPSWSEHYEYRIKPEPKPDIVVFCKTGDYGIYPDVNAKDNLCLTYDGETGKLKSAEVMK
jgi:hypothetical protein